MSTLAPKNTTKVDENSFAGRLQRLMAERNVGPSELAKMIGQSEGGIRKWLNGSQPQAEKIEKIADALGVNPLWLLSGSGSMKRDVQIRVFDLQASAGHGIEPDREDFCTISLSKDIANDFFRSSSSNIDAIIAKGDSMEPSIRTGDLIFLNRDDREVNNDTYVMRYSGAIYIKRLSRMPGNKIYVSSDNPSYPAYEIDLTDPTLDFEVIGRVVSTMKRI